MPSGIHFIVKDTPDAFGNRTALRLWLSNVAKYEGLRLEELNYVLLTDESLLEYNRKYLDHDDFTDVITFDNGEQDGIISGDVLISYDRVKDNAKRLSLSTKTELRRVMVHGLLHLCGYNDKTAKQSITIRQKEDHYLSQFIQ